MRLRELKEPKNKLVIFDIDDTLFHTTAKINVIDKATGEVIRGLTNQEFNNYRLQPGEEFDFGEFRNAEKFRDESVPIDPMLDQLKSDLSAGHDVVMLTARASFDNQPVVAKKFADHGIDINRDVHLYRAGDLPGNDSPANKKAVHVIDWLKTGKYDHVTMYDDSEKNLSVFKSIKQKFPDVDFEAHHVSPEGETKQVETQISTMRRYYAGDKNAQDELKITQMRRYFADLRRQEEEERRRKQELQRSSQIGSHVENVESDELGDSTKEIFVEIFEKFLPVAIKTIGLKNLPEFKFMDKVPYGDQPTFGMYVNDEKTLYVALVGRHPNDILRTIAHELVHFKQDTNHELGADSGDTGSPEENQANAMAGVVMRHFNRMYPEYLSVDPLVVEAWSVKYKRSINCSNPKGFSQRAHCQGRKKNEGVAENFADGRNPQDKGDSKRHGVPTKASVSTLRKVAKQGGRKGQLAHWMANMKAGRAKKK